VCFQLTGKGIPRYVMDVSYFSMKSNSLCILASTPYTSLLLAPDFPVQNQLLAHAHLVVEKEDVDIHKESGGSGSGVRSSALGGVEFRDNVGGSFPLSSWPTDAFCHIRL
jgi:hypothetical protein